MDGYTTSVGNDANNTIVGAIRRLAFSAPQPRYIELALGPRPIQDFESWWKRELRHPMYNHIEFRAHDAVPIGEMRTLRPEAHLPEIAERLARMGISAYSAHPPDGVHAPTDTDLQEWALDAFKLFKSHHIHFAVETMYYNPTRRHNLVTASSVVRFAEWARSLGWYRPLVLDLAHVKINMRAGLWPTADQADPKLDDVVRNDVHEVHVSSNDGRRDLHRPYDPGVDEDITKWLKVTNPDAPWIDEGRRKR